MMMQIVNPQNKLKETIISTLTNTQTKHNNPYVKVSICQSKKGLLSTSYLKFMVLAGPKEPWQRFGT